MRDHRKQLPIAVAYTVRRCPDACQAAASARISLAAIGREYALAKYTERIERWIAKKPDPTLPASSVTGPRIITRPYSVTFLCISLHIVISQTVIRILG